MVRLTILLLLCLTLKNLSAQSPDDRPLKPSSFGPSAGLVWDSSVKHGTPKAGESSIVYTFAVTNSSTNAITIERADVSCGCTKVEMPKAPWVLAPQDGGHVLVRFDGRGRYGTVIKQIMVHTSLGPTVLRIQAELPQPPSTRSANERQQNQQQATTNRQIVFQGTCAVCHATSTIGKSGSALYSAACGICHNAEHRASMVPDLATLKVPTSKAYWEHWVRNGKTNSLMPAFEKKQGGPLNESQITSLVDFLSSSKDFPSNTSLPSKPDR